jgi:hypothetical protein
MLTGSPWIAVRDGDSRALALYRRHYSCYRYADGRRPRRFVGPGERMVLLTEDCRALFVWRRFRDASGQTGVNCAVFRNEGPLRASTLIRAAEDLAWQRWPGTRFYTYVNPRAVASPIPGYCFRRAGWRRCGVTRKRRLLIFEKVPRPAQEVR